jgi:hypothetical protein
MTKKDFLQKYGKQKLEFSNMYKFRATYKNEELGICCSGIIEYRNEIQKEETVNSLSDLEYFAFGFIS